MERKPVWFAVCTVAVAGAVLYLGQSARATQSLGFSSKPLTSFIPTFAEFEVFSHLTDKELDQIAPTYPDHSWTAIEKTKGLSDLYIQSVTWAAGSTAQTGYSSTGWHRHPGNTLVVITSGKVVQYHADCAPQDYGPGTANGPTFVESGDDEHIVRNEDGKGATGYSVRIVPHGATPRIDEPTAPDTCQIF